MLPEVGRPWLAGALLRNLPRACAYFYTANGGGKECSESPSECGKVRYRNRLRSDSIRRARRHSLDCMGFYCTRQAVVADVTIGLSPRVKNVIQPQAVAMVQRSVHRHENQRDHALRLPRRIRTVRRGALVTTFQQA